ncbi:sulfite exporter TauE/SafE family protein [Helicobacter sp. MIT 05-5294]|uniref:sulfite exporter TauE/SafE family protein n=1 Tax=Helicobacter sp. MIT 05-5294 TaxID=1548150 RepID=UPI000A6604F5|nr:sulfite exporter TauE/SafE family protein [Helicobacter sp. MIT 05-5294]TLD86576.1 sulfite exporter TauE/SafE family protein [Helicobacter sp. MIT 05-5294]
MGHLDFISLFGIALVGGFGHCIGMCGGIVLAFSGKLVDQNISKARMIGFHLLYNLGRVSTYVMLGALVGMLGSMFSLNGTLRGALFVGAGALMMFAGLSLLGKLRFLTILERSVQNSKWYQQGFHNALSLKSPLSLYLLGILNGLLPCGFVYAFLFSAAASASIFKGALVMLVFGLSTIVPLLIFGIVANTILNQTFWRKFAMSLAALAIVVFGILMIEKGVKFLNNPQMAHKMHSMTHDSAIPPMHNHNSEQRDSASNQGDSMQMESHQKDSAHFSDEAELQMHPKDLEHKDSTQSQMCH